MRTKPITNEHCDLPDALGGDLLVHLAHPHLLVTDQQLPLPSLAQAGQALRMAAGLSLPGVPPGWADACRLVAEAPAAWHWARHA